MACPECNSAGDLVPDLRAVRSETARTSLEEEIKTLHDQCSWRGCTCQHKIPETRDAT